MTVMKRRRTPEEIREMKRRLAGEIGAIKREIAAQLKGLDPMDLAERYERKLREVEARLNAKAARRSTDDDPESA
jgi:hypothetical protein